MLVPVFFIVTDTATICPAETGAVTFQEMNCELLTEAGAERPDAKSTDAVRIKVLTSNQILECLGTNSNIAKRCSFS